MTKMLKIGIIGLDTSHVVEFTKLLNDQNNEYHVPGGKVAVAFPGGSADFEVSRSRVEGFTKQLRDEFGVQIADSPEAAAEASDAILLESVDGRVHLEQFKKIAPYGKPVFVDKPFTVNGEEARAMITLANHHHVPIMSASSTRFSEGLSEALRQNDHGTIIGAETYGPMPIVPTQPGFFWYGIHLVEMIFTILGSDCKQVTTITTDDHDVIVGMWEDGRIGTIRGNRKGNTAYGALIHREKSSRFVDVFGAHPKPLYASLMENVMKMFQTGKTDISIDETLQIVHFIEAANESRETGRTVTLCRN